MEILLKDTNQIITDQDFRNMYSNTSFPLILTSDVLDNFNAVAIMEGPHATPETPYQYNMRDGIQEIDGQFYTKYSLGPNFIDNDDKTAEEQFADYKLAVDNQLAMSIRTQRNQYLKDSDWTQVLDAPVNKTEWATYRQSLRDISLQETFPVSVEWPTPP